MPEEMSLDQKQQLFDQLRKKYTDAINKYGKAYFNQLELEKRIGHVLQTRADVFAFLEQEKAFFEDLVAKGEAKLAEEREKEELNKRMEDIMAANDARIARYPDVFFDPNATVDIRRFAGAISAIISKYSVVVRDTFGGSADSKDLEYILSDLDRFYVTEESGPSILFKHYLEELLAKGENGREAIDRKILQTGGLLLYRLRLAVQALMGLEPEKYHDQELRLGFSGNPEVKTMWKGKTKRQLVDGLVQGLQDVLDDFRLGDLVEHAYRTEYIREE